MRLKYPIITIIAFLVMVPNAHARCSQNDLSRVRIDANSITIENTLNKDNKGKYDITIKGITKDLIIYEEKSNQGYTYKDSNNGVITIAEVEGDSLVYRIYYETCDSKLMRTIRYNLPRYNYYSESSICEGLTEEIEECSMWYQGDLNREQLEKIVEEYKNTPNYIKENSPFYKTVNLIKSFVEEYYIYMIAIISILIIPIIVYIIDKKRGVLE